MTHLVKYQLFILMLFPLNSISFFQSDNLDICDLDFIQLSKLKVNSASETPKKIEELLSNIYIITSAEIKKGGYFVIDETLSDLPGFQFRNMIGFYSYIFQKEISNQKNIALVLIDGIQINELNSVCLCGGVQYNHSNFEHIKVVFGRALIVYDTSSVSGIVINIMQNQMGLRA